MRVLIVDDSAFYRKLLRDTLTALGVEVVGVAHNGRAALEKIDELRPDLITLDLEMPELDGLGVLRELRRRNSKTGVIICAALTSSAAPMATAALELGAFDLLPKIQDDPDLAATRHTLLQELGPKLTAFAGRGSAVDSPRPTPAATRVACEQLGRPRADVIVIGVSTGGPAALSQLIPMLPASLPVPVLIVQHMPPIFTKSLADDLNRLSPLRVTEACDGERLQSGSVFLAPGGKQMRIEFGSAGPAVKITDDPPERNCRPSVDYLFRSAAEFYGGRTLGVILTGMGDDGTAGCRAIKRVGGNVLSQAAASCVVYGMPRSVAEAGLTDGVFSLEELARQMIQLTAKSGWAVA